jgi:hypothetical protein
MHLDQKALTDSVVIAGTVTSPAWAAWLGDVNQVLTTATLVVGLIFGVVRLVAFLRERR